MVRGLWLRLIAPIEREVVRQERTRITRLVDATIEAVRQSRIPQSAKTDAILALLAVRGKIHTEGEHA